MKTTEHFKKTIEAHLQTVASTDPTFTKKLANPNKSIDDCCTYILNWVQKSGCNGFSDDEIYGQAIHYYDEETIDIGKPVNCKVVVNHTVELTEEEIKEAKQKAIDKVIDEERDRITRRQTIKKEEAQKVEQKTLF